MTNLCTYTTAVAFALHSVIRYHETYVYSYSGTLHLITTVHTQQRYPSCINYYNWKGYNTYADLFDIMP